MKAAQLDTRWLAGQLGVEKPDPAQNGTSTALELIHQRRSPGDRESERQQASEQASVSRLPAIGNDISIYFSDSLAHTFNSKKPRKPPVDCCRWSRWAARWTKCYFLRWHSTTGGQAKHLAFYLLLQACLRFYQQDSGRTVDYSVVVVVAVRLREKKCGKTNASRDNRVKGNPPRGSVNP